MLTPTFNLMKAQLTVFICLLFFMCGCSGKQYPPAEFETSGQALREDYDYWNSHGRPANFQPSQVAGTTNDFFVYTNIIKATNGVFHCRFGTRRPIWPPGLVAITDEGQVIFFCSTNGKVTISPDEYGVDP